MIIYKIFNEKKADMANKFNILNKGDISIMSKFNYIKRGTKYVIGATVLMQVLVAQFLEEFQEKTKL